MAVYVDNYRAHFRGMLMYHMVADSPEELHEMADKIGLKREWYQGDHYDVSLSKRKLAIKEGAIAIDCFKLVEVLKQWKAKYGDTRKRKHHG